MNRLHHSAACVLSPPPPAPGFCRLRVIEQRPNGLYSRGFHWKLRVLSLSVSFCVPVSVSVGLCHLLMSLRCLCLWSGVWCLLASGVSGAVSVSVSVSHQKEPSRGLYSGVRYVLRVRFDSIYLKKMQDPRSAISFLIIFVFKTRLQALQSSNVVNNTYFG